MTRKKIITLIASLLAVVGVVLLCVFLRNGEAEGSWYNQTFVALLPPIIAIVLALITKEVYSSLFIGILAGALLYANFNPLAAAEHLFVDGMIGSALADSYNVGILIFLVVLGCMVMLMNRAGGSAAFGRWSQKHIKTKVGASIATIILGILIFIDDYFNCLTVGSVMLPVTERQHISKEKLAYLIDATAAPVCIIAPISSWAAAVTGFIEGSNGFELFLRAIPYNLYAILTIVMMFTITIGKFDYGPMKLAELNHLAQVKEQQKAFASITQAEDQPHPPVHPNGKVIHLIFPVVVLIVCCIITMIYTGGFFDASSEAHFDFIKAFSDADASLALTYGSVSALIISIIFFIATRALSFNDCMNALPEGFKSMVPPILVLTFAWTLKAMTDSLGAKEYVAGLVSNIANVDALMSLIPAVVFLVGLGLAFATGTSWGTFGILIPIVVSVFNGDVSNELMIVCISACMAGAVCGDHCSPISDTTIMASAGANCNHVSHVSTQLPYALTVAGVSLVGYIFAGFVRNWMIVLPVSIAAMIGVLLLIRYISNRADKKKAASQQAQQ